MKAAKLATRMMMREAETKMIGIENAEPNLGTDDQGTVFLNLDTPAQGVDNEQRIGDKIKSVGLQVKYTLASQTANDDILCRVIIAMVKQDEFNNINSGILLNVNNDPVVPTANALIDVHRSVNRKQFERVLYDKVHRIGAVGSGNTSSYTFRTKYFKLAKRRTFPVDANNESEHDNLRIFFITRVPNQTAPVGRDIAIRLFTRYYYKDL